jgi:hypothetical protein
VSSTALMPVSASIFRAFSIRVRRSSFVIGVACDFIETSEAMEDGRLSIASAPRRWPNEVREVSENPVASEPS